MSYAPGDFSMIEQDHSREMLTDAYIAVTEANAWEIVAKDPGEGGFMYSESASKNLKEVTRRIKYAHSGSSYGWTMRQMQYIAKYGWENYISTL